MKLMRRFIESLGSHILRYGWFDAYGNAFLPPQVSSSNCDHSSPEELWDDEGEEEWDREWESFNSVNAQRRIRDDIAIQNRIHVNPS